MNSARLFVAFASMPVFLSMNGMAVSKTLLKDQQVVEIDMTTGWASRAQGNRGVGKFRQKLNENAGTFGPTKVLKHTKTELRYKGQRDDCTLNANGTVKCKSGAKGTWQ